jgi:hypothetical protein
MSIVWIVTTGNSDVKLTDDTGWGSLRIKKMEQLYPCENEFAPTEESNSDLFALPARVLGIAYGDAIETYWDRLTFPLLDGFCREFKTEKRNKPDRIIILLTDQNTIFDTDQRSDRDSPYWKDTCTLEPIFEQYFQDKYGIKIEPVFLQPEKDQVGLDDWNAALNLVQDKFDRLGINEDDDVIVSHQAGTPAISSAVQFASLSKFGNSVSFLTSNERTGVVSLDPYSSYFESMQIQEAKKFLNNNDYVSVASVLEKKLERLKAQNPDQAEKIIKLLEVASLWNLSKFGDLKIRIQNLFVPELNGLLTDRVKQWWWSAYEEAYLGVIRYKQENFVEAFFHSYRAVEGIFCEWGKEEFKTHIRKEEHSSTSKKQNSPETGLDRPYLQTSILDDSKNYFKDAASDKYAEKLKSMFEKLRGESKEVVLYGTTLYDLFKVCRKSYKSICKDITKFWDGNNGIEGNRNKVFHQLHGLTELELFAVRDVKAESEWKIRIKDYLNLVSEQRFQTLEEASLMARVHEELVKEIEAIAKN